MNYNEIKKLLIASATNQATATFSVEDVHTAARNGLAEYLGVDNVQSLLYLDRSDFRLIDEVITEIMPKKLENILGAWSDVRTYKYDDYVVFRAESSASERRFKDVVVPGQAAGIYRARRLDSGVLEVTTKVLTAAYNVILEEILTGDANIAKLVQLIAEGFAEQIYVEMIAAFRNLTTLSKYTGTTTSAKPDIDFAAFDEIIAKSGAYGPVTIFGFRSALSQLTNHVEISESDFVPSEDLADYRKHGRVLIYKGTPVVQLENYLLPDGDSWAFDEDDIYVIPGSTKPVKVALHGPVNTQEVNIPSGGKEWHAFRRVGVAIASAGGIGVYTVSGAYDGAY